MNHIAPKSSRLIRRPGFTLIELLTVIAIIGILAAIIIPTVSKVRETAKRAKCMSNVRQITVGLIASANQNKGQRFPDMTPADPAFGPSSTQRGGWAWDVTHTAIKDLVNQAGREALYCPASFMVANYKTEDLYQYSPNTFAVTSYVLLIPGVAQLVPQYLNEGIRSTYSITGPGGVITYTPSQRPLVVDAVISSGRDFQNVAGGLPNNVSNHMADASNPMGAHTGYVDGHVRWRRFVMAPAGTDNGEVFNFRTTGSPVFWF